MIGWDGETISISFNGAEYQVGEVLKFTLGGVVSEHVLTDDDLSAGQLTFPWSSPVKDNPDSLVVEVVDRAGNVSDRLSLEKNSTVIHSESFETEPARTIGTGEVVRLNGFELRKLSASGVSFAKGISGWAVPSPSMALTLESTGKVELAMTTHDSDFISFTAGDFNNTERLTVVFYDSLGNEVDRQILTPGGGSIQQVKASVPFGLTFSKVTLELNTSGVWIDDIEMGKTDYTMTGEHAPSPSGLNEFTFDQESYDILDFATLSSELEPQQDGVVDLSVGDITLNISVADVLALSHEDLFIHDGVKQLMINGDAGDEVTLEGLLGENGSLESWNSQGQITVGGVVYDVWQDSNQQVELLIQQGVTVRDE